MSPIQKIIAAIFARFTGRHRRLKRITSSFSKTVAELRTLRRQNTDRIAKNHTRLEKIRAINRDLDTEADEADNVARNIERLIKG